MASGDLVPPHFGVAVVSGMGVDDRLANLAMVMVGIPPAWNRASAMTTGEAEKQAADAFLERQVSDRAEHWVSG